SDVLLHVWWLGSGSVLVAPASGRSRRPRARKAYQLHGANQSGRKGNLDAAPAPAIVAGAQELGLGPSACACRRGLSPMPMAAAVLQRKTARTKDGPREAQKGQMTTAQTYSHASGRQ